MDKSTSSSGRDKLDGTRSPTSPTLSPVTHASPQLATKKAMLTAVSSPALPDYILHTPPVKKPSSELRTRSSSASAVDLPAPDRRDSPTSSSSDVTAPARPVPAVEAAPVVRPPITQLVKLDFGGMRFTTSIDTLTSGEGENFFTSLLRGQVPSYKTEEGYFFIDRNGRYFEPILDFLRTGVLYIPSNMSRKLVEELARFLMIDVGQASVTVSQEELLQHVNAMGQNGLQLPCYNLEKLTFSRLNLSGSNFAGSNLRGSSFVRTSLAKANFQDADVSSGDFAFANMQYANLINAKLQRANFSHTCLDYASLRNADLRWASLQKCTLSSASLSGARLTGACCTDLSITSLYCTRCQKNVLPSDKVHCPACLETSDVVAYNL